MSDCFVLYLLLTCMKKKTSGADKFTNNTDGKQSGGEWNHEKGYLTDTCLTAQDKYKAYLDYFRIAY